MNFIRTYSSVSGHDGRLTMLLLLAAVFVCSISGNVFGQERQFPYTFTLDSRSADTLASPDATSSSHRYRVTAWGTYSMWEDTANSSVDPVWIYSFPDEEWAKPEWRIFTEGYPIYVGDSRMFDSHGLRINDAPFPELPLDSVNHTYSTIIRGTGAPVTAAIVDWNFRGLEKRDAHDNNSGFLKVLVEELPVTDLTICAVDSSRFPTIRVSLRILRDSIQIDDIARHLELRENGRQVVIDSIDCSERIRPVSIGLVFDRSGSMNESWGSSTRLTEVKRAGRSFVDRLESNDEAAVYSFSSDVTLDQPWTNDKNSLKSAIDRLRAEGYTAMNDAVDRAISDLAVRPNGFRKAIVVLSDGVDNISRITDIQDVIDRAQTHDIPVFAVGLLLDDDDSLRALARETGGAYFGVRDPSAIDSVYGAIAEALFEKGCCSVWYQTPDDSRDGSWRSVDASATFERDTVVQKSVGYIAPGDTSSSVADEEGAYELTGTYSASVFEMAGDVYARVPRSGVYRIRFVDLLGRTVHVVGPMELSRGEHPLDWPDRIALTGVYGVIVRHPDQSVTRSVLHIMHR